MQENRAAADMPTALNIVYSSPIYANLEKERTKYWWFGINNLFLYLLESL